MVAMSIFGLLCTMDLIEGIRFVCRGGRVCFSHASSRTDVILTWVLEKGYRIDFMRKENTHYIVEPSTLRSLLLCHLLPMSELARAFEA